MKYLIIILLLFYVFYKNSNNIEFFKNLHYKNCSKYKVPKILRDVFDSNKIKKTKYVNKADFLFKCRKNDEVINFLDNNNNYKYLSSIDGCNKLASKVKLWNIVEKKYGRKEAKKLLPNTYILNNFNHMIEFQKKYKINKKYILKKPLQNKRGLLITKNLNTILNAKFYNYEIVQDLMSDLYTVKGRKVNLRIYMVIICKNNKMNIYLYDDGICMYTNKSYDNNTDNFESQITSYNMSYDVYNEVPQFINQLDLYLDRKLLWEKICNLMKKIIGAFRNEICVKNNYNSFQLFGPDIILNKKLEPYLLEINKGPSMQTLNMKERQFKFKLNNDIINLIKFDKKNNWKLI